MYMNLFGYFLEDKHIRQIIQDKTNHLVSSGYLFYSPDKETNNHYLRTMALSLLCENNGCLKCADCLKVQENSHPDLIEFPKGKSLNVQDAKDIVLEATKKPMLCSCKVIVIHGIDNSSEEAQNKLLKTIEEPPKNVYFLVSASSLNNVLPTIKSRLVKIEISPFSKKEMDQIFYDYELNENYALAIQKGEGYIGKTLNILQNGSFLEVYNLCKNIVCELKSSGEVMKYIPQKLDKEYFYNILENLSSMYRDLLMLNNGQDKLIKNTLIKNSLMSVRTEFSTNALLSILKKVDLANQKQFANVSLSLILQTLLVNILEVKYLCK